MTQLVQLTPLSPFFFGSEATFGQETNRNYYVRSNLWPQQTSLLGMLRYELLRSAPTIFDVKTDRVINEDKASKLIGEKGFEPEMDHAFGCIEQISPVFLLDPQGVPYFQLIFNQLEGPGRTWITLHQGTQQSVNISNLLAKDVDRKPVHRKNAYVLFQDKEQDNLLNEVPFDAKTDFKSQLVGANGQVLPLFYEINNAPEGIYIKVEKTGNRKNYDGSTDDSGFYKQDMFRLRAGWSFGFLSVFNTNLPPSFGVGQQVQLGAERSMFHLEVKDPTGHLAVVKQLDNFGDLFPDSALLVAPLHHLLLLSDARVEPSISQYADFSLSRSLSFRHLQTHLKDPNFFWKTDFSPKSQRYNLLQRGSSLFSKNTSQLEAALLQATAFRRIGYNYFKTIQHTSI